jgi:hypothetical protein
MTILSILGQAVSLAALATLAVRRHRRPPAKPLPDSAKLAGVPLRRLLDDPCGAGAVLRDMLTYHSPNHH